MKKVLLFGSTGNLGKKIAEELEANGYNVTAVVRNEKKRMEMAGLAQHFVIANVLKRSDLSGICNGFDVVISALGKSVSPNDWSRPSFRAVDLDANCAILEEAVKSGVQKFVYVSAFHAERYQHLEYFRVHELFSQKLVSSGLDYSIIKPPALFSAFLDLIDMAKKGQLVTLGKGDKQTNPIYEGDLARICIASIHQKNAVIEAGGKEVLSRHQINELIQQQVAPGKKLRSVPLFLAKIFLPVLKIFSRNLFDKVAFFTEVMQHDTIAPPAGETTLAEYLKRQNVQKNRQPMTN